MHRTPRWLWDNAGAAGAAGAPAEGTYTVVSAGDPSRHESVGQLVDWARIAGRNRYGTAAALSAAARRTGGAVVVATGQDFPDALAASSLAGSLGAPVVLARASSLPDETRMTNRDGCFSSFLNG